MSITDELREMTDELDKGMEDLGFVRLPKDADGVPIHVGDKLYGKTATVKELALGKYGWLISDSAGDRWLIPCSSSHSSEPTVEKVMQEMLEKAVGYSDAHTTVALNAIAEYAAKLRLANDGEEQ